MLTKLMYEYMLQLLVYIAADEYGNDEEVDNIGDEHEKLWLALSSEEKDICNSLLKQYKEGEKREFMLSIVHKIISFANNKEIRIK